MAERIASELDQKIGESVGYAIRFDDRVSESTAVKLMTDGILLAETQTDPLLRAYDTLIIDEASMVRADLFDALTAALELYGPRPGTPFGGVQLVLVGDLYQLPPVVTLQYHFNSAGKVSPFIGAGLNYTTFFSESTGGALAGSKLKLDDSFGLAAHVGLDFNISPKAAIRVDARWADIDTDVKLDGAKLGTVNIDPLVYGASYVVRF